jgi:recombinational DNA repair ATPase RecF
MIQLESVHIEELRGIRSLDIDLRRETFVLCGPNGSGKSGVVDAIEFGLTGQIGRLTGRGTKGLSVAEHGPHVDKVKFPEAANVTLKVFLTDLKQSVTITRKISAPTKPKVSPDSDEIRKALREIADHPELTLSRREILRFILVEPTKRSDEIQAILKLEEIGRTRAALNTALNKVGTQRKTASAQSNAAKDALRLHLQIPKLGEEEVLEAVNKRRELLGLEKISALKADTEVDAGMLAPATATLNKSSALRDLGALEGALKQSAQTGNAEALAIVSDLETLEREPDLVDALNMHALVERGLALVKGASCPLCDTPWEKEQKLKSHLQEKLAKSAKAQALQQRMRTNANVLAQAVIQLDALLAAALKIAVQEGLKAAGDDLEALKSDLGRLRQALTPEHVAALKPRLQTGWLSGLDKVLAHVHDLHGVIAAKPDQSAALDAQTFLTTAAVRLRDYRGGMREDSAAERSHKAAKAAYEAYCGVLEDELNDLYNEVEHDFSEFYRSLNSDDESSFTAKLTPEEGKLDLKVNFYERGLYPPGAYHSEGHQDGMGVCLYLALMKRLLGDRFTLALLDDVVMSVDSGHRYQFCKLLKAKFPDTQFVITTHDRVWAEQMRSAGLVTSKRLLAFQGWTVDSGPLVESNLGIWEKIDGFLKKGEVQAAAAALRHHLEYASRQLAHELSASTPFRADGNYELGDLMPNVLGRLKDLYGKAADAAQSWGNQEARQAIAERKKSLAESSGAAQVEQWAVNKAVHYNEWANFGKKDFEPVTAAFKELFEHFRCASCDGWLHASPRSMPETLRCSCKSLSFNLKPKPK